jgi:hypothetical protein
MASTLHDWSAPSLPIPEHAGVAHLTTCYTTMNYGRVNDHKLEALCKPCNDNHYSICTTHTTLHSQSCTPAHCGYKDPRLPASQLAQ